MNSFFLLKLRYVLSCNCQNVCSQFVVDEQGYRRTDTLVVKIPRSDRSLLFGYVQSIHDGGKTYIYIHTYMHIYVHTCAHTYVHIYINSMDPELVTLTIGCGISHKVQNIQMSIQYIRFSSVGYYILFYISLMVPQYYEICQALSEFICKEKIKYLQNLGPTISVLLNIIKYMWINLPFIKNGSAVLYEAGTYTGTNDKLLLLISTPSFIFHEFQLMRHQHFCLPVNFHETWCVPFETLFYSFL
jgi:hypothetical protein